MLEFRDWGVGGFWWNGRVGLGVCEWDIWEWVELR